MKCLLSYITVVDLLHLFLRNALVLLRLCNVAVTVSFLFSRRFCSSVIVISTSMSSLCSYCVVMVFAVCVCCFTRRDIVFLFNFCGCRRRVYRIVVNLELKKTNYFRLSITLRRLKHADVVATPLNNYISSLNLDNARRISVTCPYLFHVRI